MSRRKRPALFGGRHFADEIIVLCVRWYLRYSLSYRDLEEMMAERNLSVDHTTIWRWVQRYAPMLASRIKRELKPTGRSWRVDETYSTSAWLGNGPICTERWTRVAPASISICRRSGMRLPPSSSSVRPWQRRIILVPE